jgi:hypothetical protein
MIPITEIGYVRSCEVPDSGADIGLRQVVNGSALPKFPQIRFTRGTISGLQWFAHCYGLSGCSPPCTDPTSFLAVGDLYFQASNGSVALPVAGYDYSIDWTPLLAGFAPAGMAASLAARQLVCYLARTTRLLTTTPETPGRVSLRLDV